MNVHPFGYIRGGGDAVQIFNFDKFADFAQYTWINEGEGYAANFFAYGVEYGVIHFFATLFSLAVSQQSFFYYLIFLSLSFWSFFIGLRLFDQGKKISIHAVSGLSFAYAMSSYTLYAFDSGWAFTPYLNLYFIVPVFFASVYRWYHDYGITVPRVAGIALTTALLLFGMQNLAFIVALQIFLSFFIIALFLFKELSLSRDFFVKTLIYIGCLLLFLSPLIIPQFTNVLALTEHIVVMNRSVLNDWIAWQSVPFSSLFFYLFSFDFFARQNGAPILLSVIYFALALLSIRTASKKKLSFVFFFVLVCSFIILNKGKGLIPPEITSLLFSNALMGAVRSYDKSLLFVPYFSIMTFALSLQSIKHSRLLLVLLVSASVLFNRHLISGDLVTHHALSYNAGESYLTARYSPIFKIPDEYYHVANELNSERVYGKLLQTPYTVISSPGWMNLPKMKYIGLDPITQLFSSPSINMASVRSFEERGKPWNYGAVWNTSSLASSNWLPNLASRMNVRYIVYRKETDDRFLNQTRAKIQKYLDEHTISLVTANRWFELYELTPEMFTPQIVAPLRVLLSSVPLQRMPELLSQVDNDTMVVLTRQNDQKRTAPFTTDTITPLVPPVLEYKKINPTKYVVRVHNATGPFFVALRESYHADWKARASSYRPERISAELLENSTADNVPEDRWKASKQELKTFVRDGIVSTLGDGTTTSHSSVAWSRTYPVRITGTPTSVDYVSKNIHRSIQNENLNGMVAQSSYHLPDSSHSVVDGYANGWYIQPRELCKKIACRTSTDGRSFELALEFRQQSVLESSLLLYYATIVITGIGTVGYYRFRKKHQ